MAESVGIVGAGTMGVGIAYVFAAAGFETHVVEPDEARAEALGEVVAAQARSGVERGKLTQARGEAVPGLVRRVAAIDRPARAARADRRVRAGAPRAQARGARGDGATGAGAAGDQHELAA